MRIKLVLIFILIAGLVAFLLVLFPKHKKNWEEIKGYEETLHNCEKLCQAYIFSKCSQTNAISFCFYFEEIDLDENGKIEEKKGTSPLGIDACEDKVYCPFILECKCGKKTLDVYTCAKIKCDMLHDYYNISKTEAEKIVNNLFWGSCNVPEKRLC